ncbi:hypothetical protein, partial [Saccharothrix sp. ST-888]|uniref:hypothetical protein n=1 Tax=Saccharothrix sp. ST-888 TaxID=1427391 RepID=UPI0005EC502B
DTRSARLVSAVVAAVLVGNLVVRLLPSRRLDLSDPMKLLLWLNLTAAPVTALVLACRSPVRFPVAEGVILTLALLNSAVNTARVKALVQFFDRVHTNLYSAVFNSSLF